MERTATGWTVIDRGAAVLSREYVFRGGTTAKTFVAKMGDGTLMAVSPSIGLSEDAAAELDGFGPLGALIAPNGMHHMGLTDWRARYPEVPIFAPAAAIARLRKQSPAAQTVRPLGELRARLGDGVGITEADDTRFGESWCWARTNEGHVLYASDMLINMPKVPPFPAGLLFRVTKSAPGYRPFGLALTVMLKKKKDALRALLHDVESHPVSVVVPAHGDLVANEAVQAETVEMLRAAL